MKKLILSLTLLSFLYSCDTKDTNTYETVKSLQGHWFLQPANRKVALSLVNIQGAVSINFIDSAYCNLDISSIGGDLTLSRKYRIDSNKIVFEDPTTNIFITYNIGTLNMKDSTFIISDYDNNPYFKGIPYNDKTRMLLNSESALQKQEFLYPTLDLKERAGLHFEEVDGKLNKVEPEKSDVDIYKMF